MSSSSKVCLTKRTFSDFIEGEEETDCYIGNPIEEDDFIEQKTTEQYGCGSSSHNHINYFGEFQSLPKRRKIFSSAIKSFFENTQNGLLSPSASNQKVQEILKEMKGAFPTSEELGMNSTRKFIRRYTKEKQENKQKQTKSTTKKPTVHQQSAAAVAPQQEEASSSSQSSQSSQPTSSSQAVDVAVEKEGKKVYTEEEVEDLLQAREKQLKTQYDNRLQELMGDLFEQFIQFNHDYIDKSYNDKACSYLS